MREGGQEKKMSSSNNPRAKEKRRITVKKRSRDVKVIGPCNVPVFFVPGLQCPCVFVEGSSSKSAVLPGAVVLSPLQRNVEGTTKCALWAFAP